MDDVLYKYIDIDIAYAAKACTALWQFVASKLAK